MKLRWFLIILGVTGIAFGGAYFVDFINQHPTFEKRLTADFLLIIIAAVVLQIAGHFSRAYKSRFLLDQVRKTKTSVLFKGLSVGYLFNTLLPMRLGEVIRAVHVGDAMSISKTTVFVSIIIERIVDGIILGLSLAGAGLAIRSTAPEAFAPITRIGLGIFGVSLVLTILLGFAKSENQRLLKIIHGMSGIFNQKISDRFRFMAWSGIYGTKLMLSNKTSLKKYIAASIIMWGFYFSSTLCVIVAFFGGLAPKELWYATQSTYAGVSAPAGPGYIGSFHVILSELLSKIRLGGISSFSTLIWLVLIVPISIVGTYVLLRQKFGQQSDVENQEMLINKLYRGKDISREFGHFLDAYLKGEKINHLLTQAELDDKFKLIRSFKNGSNAHTMLVWQDNEVRVKKITLPQFADKLDFQAQWLISYKNLPHLPRVLTQEKTDQYYYFDLAYHEDFFPFFEFIHSHTTKENFRILSSTFEFMNKEIYKPVAIANGTVMVKRYIDEKVLGKINDTAAMSPEIGQLLTKKTIKVNGTKCDNILQIIDKIKKNKLAMQDLSSYSESPIHGDLTIDNLIANESGDFMILDPNNENQVSSPVVDYGKMYQSLHSGYEFLIQLETCNIDENSIQFEDAKSHKYADLFQLFDTKLKKELDPPTYRTILFHEAIHYCRMLTYRVNIEPRTIPVFYATAVRLFNEYLEQYGKN